MDASAVEIGVWLVSGASVMAMANQALKLTDRLKEKPNPAETYMTKEQCAMQRAATDARVNRLETELSGLRSTIDELGHANEQRASELHKRINGLKEDISQVPSQVIALIRNTKGL